MLKEITPEVLNKYINACSYGDVPNWGLALYSYLIMDGYIQKPEKKSHVSN